MVRFDSQDAAVRTTSAAAQHPGTSATTSPFPAVDAAGILERATAVLERQTASAMPAAGLRSSPAPATIPMSMPVPASAIEDLRQQARDWVDRVLAIVGQGPARDALERGAGAVTAVAPIALPMLSSAIAARPGESVQIPMRLVNDAPAAARPGFAATDLLGDAGHRIPASAISFWPANPIMQPGEQTAVEVRVTVPADAHAGNYSGLIQIISQPDARTLFAIKVG